MQCPSHRLQHHGECLNLTGALGHVGGATRSRGVGGTRRRRRRSAGAERPRRTRLAHETPPLRHKSGYARAVGQDAAPGVCAGVERTHAALARPRPVLVGALGAGETRALPRPVLEIAHFTRGARCPVGPMVPFLFEERFENNEGPQPESCVPLPLHTTLDQTGGEARRWAELDPNLSTPIPELEPSNLDPHHAPHCSPQRGALQSPLLWLRDGLHQDSTINPGCWDPHIARAVGQAAAPGV